MRGAAPRTRRVKPTEPWHRAVGRVKPSPAEPWGIAAPDGVCVGDARVGWEEEFAVVIWLAYKRRCDKGAWPRRRGEAADCSATLGGVATQRCDAPGSLIG